MRLVTRITFSVVFLYHTANSEFLSQLYIAKRASHTDLHKLASQFMTNNTLLMLMSELTPSSFISLLPAHNSPHPTFFLPNAFNSLKPSLKKVFTENGQRSKMFYWIINIVSVTCHTFFFHFFVILRSDSCRLYQDKKQQIIFLKTVISAMSLFSLFVIIQ